MPVRRGIPALIAGAVLLAWSARPLFLIARELLIRHQLAGEFEWVPTQVSNIDMALREDLGGHHVELQDDVPLTSEASARVEGPVRILVDGRDYSTREIARIRPAYSDPNRYLGSVTLARLLDKRASRPYLVVAQSLRGNKYRVLWIDADGKVTEDVFGRDEICARPVRAMIVRHVTPSPIGFCSDILQVWPSLVFPILYPFVSGFAGLVLVVFGAIRARRVAV
jgi:hypothetical protein